MLLQDFTNIGNTKVDTNWNINQFVSSKKKKSAYVVTSDLSPESSSDLEKIIKTLDIEYSKITSELDKAAKDLTAMGTQLKNRIDAFSKGGEPGEVEIMYRKTAIDLIVSKTKLAETKSKLFESKLKQIRDERKLMLERDKLNGGGSQSVNVSGSPLVSTANAIINGGGLTNTLGIDVNPAAFNMLRTQQPVTTNSGGGVEQKPTDSTFQVERKLAGESEIPNENQAISRPTMSNLGVETKTVGEQFNSNMNLIKNRESNKEELFKNHVGLLGSKYTNALDSLVSNSKNIVEVMTIDKNTGRYWIDGYEVDENGNRTLCPEYRHKSLIHVGKLRFDAKNHQVKTVHYDDMIEYQIGDESNMNEFYKTQWQKDSSEQFILDETVTELL